MRRRDREMSVAFEVTNLFRTAVWKVVMKDITGKRKKYDSEGIEMKFGRMK